MIQSLVCTGQKLMAVVARASADHHHMTDAAGRLAVRPLPPSTPQQSDPRIGLQTFQKSGQCKAGQMDRDQIKTFLNQVRSDTINTTPHDAKCVGSPIKASTFDRWYD